MARRIWIKCVEGIKPCRLALGCEAGQYNSCGIQLCWLATIELEVSSVAVERGIHKAFG